MSLTVLSSKSLLTSLDHFKQLVLEHDKLLDENIELKHKLKELDDVNKSFMSVSLIVSTKNENEKLRNELALLKKRLAHLEKELKDASNKRSLLYTKSDQDTTLVIPVAEEKANHEAKEEEEANDEDEEEEDVEEEEDEEEEDVE